MGMVAADNVEAALFVKQSRLATATDAHNVIIAPCGRTNRHKRHLKQLKPLLSLHINVTQPDFSRRLVNWLEARAYQLSTPPWSSHALMQMCVKERECISVWQKVCISSDPFQSTVRPAGRSQHIASDPV